MPKIGLMPMMAAGRTEILHYPRTGSGQLGHFFLHRDLGLINFNSIFLSKLNICPAVIPVFNSCTPFGNNDRLIHREGPTYLAAFFSSSIIPAYVLVETDKVRILQ